MDVSTDSRRAPTADGENDLSPLEQEVLDEYAKLVGNLDNVLKIRAMMSTCLHADEVTAFWRSG